jgi:hypothetical protein
VGKIIVPAPVLILTATQITAVLAITNAQAVRSVPMAIAFAQPISPIAPAFALTPRAISKTAETVKTNAYLAKLAPIANAFIVVPLAKMHVLELVST